MPFTKNNRMITLTVIASILMVSIGLVGIIVIEGMPNPNHSLSYMALLMVLMSLKVFLGIIQAEVARRSTIEAVKKETTTLENLIHGDMHAILTNIEPLVEKMTKKAVDDRLAELLRTQHGKADIVRREGDKAV